MVVNSAECCKGVNPLVIESIVRQIAFRQVDTGHKKSHLMKAALATGTTAGAKLAVVYRSDTPGW